jgi:hypothetical protein
MAWCSSGTKLYLSGCTILMKYLHGTDNLALHTTIRYDIGGNISAILAITSGVEAPVRS